uniref:Cation-transporting P-type ATPase N-terminal domain-containing protein n=1 Tax=Alexandrium monilatum TaxID=311494 RepID=A0A7S4QXK3_9DINO|mmetsp:Transcript_94150/g.298865  ORF Transcript_94150/g.298865 Transcript_94150/m.298865 type:complete len:1045 (+) Transcript_94150:85-3219(+)
MQPQARQPLVSRTSSCDVEEAQGEEDAGGLQRGPSGELAWTSRLEHRVPAEYETRSWRVEDAQQGTSAPPSLGRVESPPAEAARREHELDSKKLAAELHSDLERGLDGDRARELLARDGPNEITPPPRTPAVVKFLMQLYSGFAPILWAAALLCFFAYWPLGNRPPQEGDDLNLALGLVLVVVILLQAAFNFYQEYKSDCIMERLNAMIPASASVIRGGDRRSVPVQELVVGDLVVVGGGEKIPADLRLVSVKDLKIDKSTLNGESEPVKCTTQSTDRNFMETRNMAFFGCSAVEGSGVGIVVATGDRTVFGDIARAASAPSTELSTLHAEIRRFVQVIAGLALGTGALAFLGWLVWLRPYHPDFLTLTAQMVNCISLIVAFVPEGMPVCVTVTLALIAADMSRSNVLVKNLGVVETLGAVSVIASDKTGTLTENRMTVSQLSQAEPSPWHQHLLRAMLLCNRAAHVDGEIVGDASDSALLRHYCQEVVSGAVPEAESTRDRFAKLAEVPFNSTNKYMLSVHSTPDEGDRLLLMKGAPERMLERCSTVAEPTGAEDQLTSNSRSAVLHSIEQAAAQGQRILGFCQLRLPAADFGGDFAFDVDEPNFPMSGLTFLGWVALRDPPRAGVREAIAQCHAAQVRVAMVTGDHPATAKAIAQQVGIISTEDVDGAGRLTARPRGPPGSCAIVLTGPELERLEEEDWHAICQYRQAVFSRTTPKQKLQIVKLFQAQGECVGVTGDGVNDAPALKQANCGLAMGSGSEVSKEAADLIVLDDNFASVVKGIEHGRRCFANLKKVIIYLLPAGSFSEMLPVMTNVFLGMPVALSSFLMIIICCFTDVGPSLALVYEKPESRLMSLPPRKLGKDHLVDWKLLLNAYLFIGLIEAGVAYATFFTYYASRGKNPGDVLFTFGAPSAADDPDGEYGEMQNVGQCLYFYALVVMQFGNALTSRTAMLPIWRQSPFSGPTRNPRLFGAMVVSAVLLVLTCYLPPVQTALLTRKLPSLQEDWLALLLPWLGALVLVCLNETRKGVAERYPDGVLARVAWR